MGKLLKIGLGIVGALLLVVVLAVGAFALFFDPNDFRSQITKATKDATGRELTVGDIKLSIYPVLGARVQAVSLSNAPRFGDQPMAQIAEADVGLKLLPLVLQRELKVGKVVLNGLNLRLAKNAEGVSNWDDLTKTGEKKPDAPADAPSEGPGLKSINIGGITINDANIAYDDAKAKQSYAVSGLNLSTGSITPGEPFDLKLDFSTTAKSPALKADVKLATRVEYDLAQQQYAADKLVLKVLATMPDQKADIELAGNVKADLAKQTANVDKLTVKVKAEQKELKADVALAVGISAVIDKQQVRAEKIALKIDAEGKALPGGKQTVNFTGDAIYDGSKGTMKLAGGDVQVAGLDATIALDGIGLDGDSPRFYGPISVKTFNPRDLMKLLDIKVETADANVLKELSLRGKIDATPKSARIAELTLKLDQSTATGSLGISNFDTKAAEFALKLDAIDADRYLPTPAPVKPGPLTAEEKAAANAVEPPVQSLDGFTANGTVDIGKLKVSNVSMNNVQFRLNATQGQDKVIGLNAQLYGGSIASTTKITADGTPRYAERLQLTSISAGPLLKDFTGKESMPGEGNFALDVTSTGKTVGAIKQALNGDASFSFVNGAVKGFNLGQILRKGDALLKGQQFNDSAPVQTDFTELSAAAKIVNGVLQSDALNAKSPLFRVDGAGKVDLARETIDYTAKPTIVNTASGQGGKDLPDLTGIVIPIRVTGTFDQPKYALDLKAALIQKATQGLRDQLVGDKGDKLREKLDTQIEKKLGTSLDANPALKDKLTNGLNSLFGKKKPPADPAAAPAPAPAPAAPAPAPTPAPTP